ncbi:sigma-54-dependent Fis family transcriptional regulator [Neptuniibacter sp.]|uniref:sigma-54-dependent Fis family transcriptional regulator n=1 Tax=Neptuniibacter sp. TaxID=1962643 RepID=UPI0026295E62|nr:sigma-54-dependent Fis family transcriptional regulator [Neptuniibacter sp.]MCP4597122.1 sigma-54-dependent Fis family transcriptional regulator [Neptuniibacter sp.]
MTSERTQLPAPSTEDLLAEIKFDIENGKIWLSEQRMLLIHSGVMGSLRKELIETLGVERAKGLLMRFGYAAGQRDAELAKRIRPDLTSREAFWVGPQMHTIEGIVKVKPIHMEMDIEKGEFSGEFDWHGSYEAEIHMADFGPSDSPVCWTLLGYASGYTSYYMQRRILFKETQCVACGAGHCTNVGKPIEEWDDPEEIERYLKPDPIIDQLISLQSEVDVFRSGIGLQQEDEQLYKSVGKSPAFKKVCRLINRASQSRVTTLLLGETGVGKEIVAKGLHVSSDRSDKPFVAVNCATLPQELIESELFGVEKGAYTGATQSRIGKFERAHGGTIFLDEVIELPARAQASLLRVLQEGELEKVGGNQTQNIDVRIVAATNEDLQQAVQEGRFRADLFYRLNVFPVFIPPLRERTEDIPALVEHFLDKYHNMYHKLTLGISDKAMNAFKDYSWPGNIRELENMIERGIILTDNNQQIGLEDFFPSLVEPSHPLNIIDKTGNLCEENSTTEANDLNRQAQELLKDGFDMEAFEEVLIHNAMQQCEGNVSKAARKLGISRPTLAYKLKKISGE